MRLVVVTTCTNRKRHPVPPSLDASTLLSGSQANVAREWRNRLAIANAVATATDVYCGRSFQEAASAARAARADFRVISGGLGLVKGDEAIPAYSLSLVQQSPEYIGSRVIGAPFVAPLWWSQVQKTDARPLAKLLETDRNAIAVIAISGPYLYFISADLKSLSDDELNRIRLIGSGIEKSCPRRLRPCVLPYDDRLDGADSPIRGTRGDFSSRALRHFLEDVLPDHRLGSLQIHKEAVGRRLSRWRRQKPVSRPSRTDEEIIQLIKKNWTTIQGQSSKGLRYLRDVEQIACEQGRFRLLFSRAASEASS